MALEQFSDVIKRCQAIQYDAYATEDYDIFTVSGQACLEEGHSAQVLNIIVDERNKDTVRCMGWTLLRPLIRVLPGSGDENRTYCLGILKYLLEVCSPKELLLGLLEEIEGATSDALPDTFLLLLNPLSTVLRRLGSRKASSLGMVLATVLEQLVRLPVPHGAQGEEAGAGEGGGGSPLGRCCSMVTAFVAPFVLEARLDGMSRGRPRRGSPRRAGPEVEEDELRAELLKFCMKSLSEPLLQVHLMGPDTESPLWEFATNILSSLTAIGEPLHKLVYQPLRKREKVPGFLEEEVRYPKESLASLAYLLFVNHLAMETFPAVFSPVFNLRCNMEHVNLLLSRTEESWIHKGLELYEKCLVMVEDGGLSVNELEIKVFITVPENLVKVMTLCPKQHLRVKGLKLLQLSIDKFSTEAKYKFFQCMLKISGHSGVEGYIIKNIRNQVDFSLKPGNANKWFLGVHLPPLLHQVLCLPDGPETDLLQYLDRIMESLNLLRYLVLRDKASENQTGIWTELPAVEERFMKPLRVGVNMSRAHYEMELANTAENKKGNSNEETVVSLTVGDEMIPQMTSESQMQALHSALHTFDMIESVLVRVEEIIEAKDTL